ncbi:SPOR domain-containing protein [Sphingomonas sp. CLY1604]|uniref:SPOR domain-containing protein n=1 Tax=Sphingomonas sp. CLY1604 TaxID=3457786 RepID=UPI003FD7F8EA
MRLLIPAVLALACAPAALAAQEVVQPLPGTTDADRLAEQMRAVAANPRDVTALLTAADLSLSLGDLSGAASLYARAEKVAPNDPRIKAGEGAILVRSERPGEALRYFAQAEAAGFDIRPVAADRGLAYDLVGQQERAQRDYRLALKTRPDDETIRRYALSLGISGKREAALEQLDPLLRKNDRSAWRIRAFVLAMGGDQAGAEKIATTMLPTGMAQGLQPFFRRLPTLGAVDRAFAVHFGEVRATPERLADARLAPVLPQLAPEAAPVALAAVQPAQPDRRRGRTRRGREEAAPAVAVAANTARAAAAPSYQAATAALARVQPVPTEVRAPGVTFASAAPVVQPLPVAKEPVTAAVVPTAPPRAAVAAATVQPLPATAVTTPAPEPTRVASAVTAAVVPAPGFATAAVEPAVPPAPTVAAAPASSFTAPPSRSEADSVLARIVAGLTIPASELGVVEPARPAPVVAAPAPDTAARVIAEAKAKEERDAAAEKALAAKAAADKRAADRKAAADKKALAAKKLADAEKLAEAKAAAEEKKAARANPERIWVQVAGGAYEGGLPKAYAIMKAKAPEVFGSRPGWTTPLRATNRVLTGPFKTDAEARAFVNQLAKAGVPAFAFTSEAGQVVTKLPAK